jgi:hypothetical protein
LKQIGPTSAAPQQRNTFRIPPQAALSDAEFYFLIFKLRGREIGARDWDLAVRQVRDVRFGTPLGRSVAGVEDGESDAEKVEKELDDGFERAEKKGRELEEL